MSPIMRQHKQSGHQVRKPLGWLLLITFLPCIIATPICIMVVVTFKAILDYTICPRTPQLPKVPKKIKLRKRQCKRSVLHTDEDGFRSLESLDNPSQTQTGREIPLIIVTLAPPLANEDWEAITQPTPQPRGKLGRMRHRCRRACPEVLAYELPYLSVPPKCFKVRERRDHERLEEALARKRYETVLASSLHKERVDSRKNPSDELHTASKRPEQSKRGERSQQKKDIEVRVQMDNNG